ncbi:MAG: C1 family peptidase [Ignavibacteriae bacterium]|nr:C1 family peptidase [Ignavibacteriota bacterium]
MKKIYLVLVLSFFFSQLVFSQFNYPSGLLPADKEKYDALPKFEVGTRGNIKSFVDYSKQFPPPGYQGNQNSCAAWAVAYVMSYLDNFDKSIYDENLTSADYEKIYSPSFIYNLINQGYNFGVPFEKVFYVVKNIGCVKLKDMPYNEKDFCHEPGKELIKKAYDNRIKEYYIGNTITTDNFKATISDGYPIIIGTAVDNNFVESGKNYSSSDPYIWKEYKKEICLDFGFHAMVITGYDDSIKAFKVLNSYGKDWGNKGYVWISYDFLSTCVKEAYIISK